MNLAHQFHDAEPDADLAQAALMMRQALDVLDRAGEARAAIHLQHAIETLEMRQAAIARSR